MNIDIQLKKLAKGDVSAFDSVYYQTRKPVFYIVLSIVKDKSVAEDVTQSAYLSIIKNASTYRSGTNAFAWIARIARNAALNAKKKRGREIYVDERENLDMFGVQQTDDYGLLTDLARDVLSADEFNILMFYACEGYSRREISEMLEMPTSTVTHKYNCAIQKMRKALER